MKILLVDSALLNTHFCILNHDYCFIASKGRDVLPFKMAADLDLGYVNLTLTFISYENITIEFSIVKYIYFVF